MTPEARLAAAAELLDDWLAGVPAEKALTTWARRSRFAGSKDRAAVRDHVFDAIRQRRSTAWLGGGDSGRAMMIGLLRANGRDPADFLTGQGHALAPLSEAEAGMPEAPGGNVARDCPDWLEPELRESLGAEFEPILQLLKTRAPVWLRVNAARISREAARARLAEEGIDCVTAPSAPYALRVEQGARRLRNSRAYAEGLVEIQDLASQAAAGAVPLPDGGRILDFCAGGGGKALALAARGAEEIFVHDANPGRMKDIPERARRAGARLTPLASEALLDRAPFDLVLTDVPCSGSGAWRRQPEAKWRLTREELARIRRLQRQILTEASRLSSPGGCIAYLTCSLLRCENEAQISGFLDENPHWSAGVSKRYSPLEGGDGFYLALLRRED